MPQDYETSIDINMTAECTEINNEEAVQVTQLQINNDQTYCKKQGRSLLITNCSFNNRRKIANLRRTIYRLRREVKLVQKSVAKQYKDFKNFPELPEFIREFVLVILKHFRKGSRPKTYSALLREFALTLHYYSPTGYNYVRVKFYLAYLVIKQ